ncbi:hypothetical protein C0J52_00749 [Blattella germanica]|nr:hypothetical protein C0J52_00749 [Blattella germanica]
MQTGVSNSEIDGADTPGQFCITTSSQYSVAKLKQRDDTLLTPRAMACAMPNLGTLRAHSGLKWSVRQILPPLYIFAVFPSNSGSAISGAVVGYRGEQVEMDNNCSDVEVEQKYCDVVVKEEGSLSPNTVPENEIENLVEESGHFVKVEIKSDEDSKWPLENTMKPFESSESAHASIRRLEGDQINELRNYSHFMGNRAELLKNSLSSKEFGKSFFVKENFKEVGTIIDNEHQLCKKPILYEIDLQEQKNAPFECKICNKSFYNRGTFYKHKFIHTDNAPFECEKCKKEFPWKSLLERHMVIYAAILSPTEMLSTKTRFFIQTEHLDVKFVCNILLLKVNLFDTTLDTRESDRLHVQYATELSRRGEQIEMDNNCSDIEVERKYCDVVVKEEGSLSPNTVPENEIESVVFPVKEEFVDLEHMEPKNSIAINIKEDVKDSYPLGLARDYQSEVLKEDTGSLDHFHKVEVKCETNYLGDKSESIKLIDTLQLGHETNLVLGEELDDLAVNKDNIDKKTKLCDERVPLKQDFQERSISPFDDAAVQCQVCDKYFPRQSDLDRHKAIHGGSRPFECEVCKKSFAKKFNLITHMSIHVSDNIQFQCKVCMKYLSSRSNLSRHMYTHTGNRPFECEVCKKSFIRKGDLYRHMKCHRSST